MSVKSIKKLFGELIMIFVVLLTLLVTVIVTLASVIMISTNRKSLKFYWSGLGSLWERYWLLPLLSYRSMKQDCLILRVHRHL